MNKKNGRVVRAFFKYSKVICPAPKVLQIRAMRFNLAATNIINSFSCTFRLASQPQSGIDGFCASHLLSG